MREEFSVSNRFYGSRVHLRVSLLNLLIVRPQGRSGESVQQISNQFLPIFFGKLYRLSLDVCQLNHVAILGVKMAPRNLEIATSFQYSREIF